MGADDCPLILPPRLLIASQIVFLPSTLGRSFSSDTTSGFHSKNLGFLSRFNVGGAVGLSTAANIFLGMVEAPLFIRPYLTNLSRSELFMVMTGGMAGIAGTVLVLYATLLGPFIPNAAAHFVIASVLGAPAAILVSMIMVPERVEGHTGGASIEIGPIASSTMDAIVKGTAVGLELLLNICAILIVMVALVHLADAVIAGLPAVGGAPLTLERALGTVMAPVCWLMGIPWQQAMAAGSLMGMKTVLNEFIAYVELSRLPADALDARSRLIMLSMGCVALPISARWGS